MKKIIYLILLIIIGFSIGGCINTPNEDFNNKIIIYSLNDLHGAIFEDGQEAGMSKIGDFLIKQKEKYPDSVVILSAGDMFQGTAVSSLTKGKIVVDLMNEIGFDAMTIGNHEFDWGIEGITRFMDGDDENGEANFPLLSANIYQKSKNDLADFATPYTVIERGPLRIGIIGTLGESQTNDILASIVADYQFTDQLTAIKNYTKILRTEENCDIVIVSSHSDTKAINQSLANLDGDYKVDAVLNGHTHYYYAGEEHGTRSVPLPYVQSGNNGKYIGKIVLDIDPETKQVTDVSASNLATTTYCRSENSKLTQIINQYQDVITQANQVLGVAGKTLNRTEGTQWAADTIRKHADADVGIVNGGGIRSAAFPISKDSTVTFGTIFKMMPFENIVMKVQLTGAQLKSVIDLNRDSLFFSANINVLNKTINNQPIADDQLYLVATIDYVFEKQVYNFYAGQNIVNTNILFRDYLVNEVLASVQETGKWLS